MQERPSDSPGPPSDIAGDAASGSPLEARLSRLEARVESLTAQIARIEQLSARLAPGARDAPTSAPPAMPATAHPPAAPTTAPPPVAPPVIAPPRIGPPPVTTAPPDRLPAAPPIAPPVQPAAPAAAPARRAAMQRLVEGPAPAAPGSRSIEALIGAKWTAWVGAVIVVVAIALLAHLGYTSGWWGGIPPLLRCLGIAAFGAALLAAGELLRRRLGPMASTGLFAAGLGTLYLDAFAAHAAFGLVDEAGALLIMACASALGFGITLRTRSLVIGVLSLVAGYASPVLLWSFEPLAVLVAHQTLLLGVGLALSAFASRSFRPLRVVCLAGQHTIAVLWVFWVMPPSLPLLVALSVWWGMFLAESLYAALRRQTAILNVVAVTVTTLMLVTLGSVTLVRQPVFDGRWHGVFTFAVALMCAVTTFQFGPGLHALRRPPVHAIDRLSIALWLLAGSLLATAIGFQFRGAGQTIGWLAVGLAAVEAGRRLPSRGVLRFGTVILVLTAIKSVLVDPQVGSLSHVLWGGPGIRIDGWAILIVCVILGLALAAARMRPMRVPVARGIVIGLACLAWLLLTGLRLQEELILLAATLAPLLLAVRARMTGDRVSAWFAVVLGGGMSAFLFLLLAARMNDPTMLAVRHRLLFFNPLFAGALLLGLTAYLSGRALARSDGARRGGFADLLVTLAPAFPLFYGAADLVRLHRTATAAGAAPTDTRLLIAGTWWAASALLLAALRGRVPFVRRSGTGTLVDLSLAIAGAGAWASGCMQLHLARLDGIGIAAVWTVEALGGALLIAALGVIAARSQGPVDAEDRSPAAAPFAGALALLAVLALGTVLLERGFGWGTGARDLGWSTWWALMGVGLVVGGFVRPIRWVRLAGLALLGLTTIKVLFVDLARVGGLFRVGSFLAAGMLLIVTSIIYSRLESRRPDAGRRTERDGEAPDG